jgi:glycine dehydrogenase
LRISIPFAPRGSDAGLHVELDEQLRAWLCQATGYAGISLQPNAGSQGEYAGLLAIKAFHNAKRVEGHRTICLIPSSRPTAPTPPARRWRACRWSSPSLRCQNGNVDMTDLESQV